MYERVLASEERALGEDHPDTLITVNDLGILLMKQGKLDEAEPLYWEALEASRATLGDRHPHTLVSISNMTLLLKAQGKLDETEALR